MLQDLRFALRTLARTPGFTAMAVLILALGIGPTTAIYSVVEGVLLRPLPYRDPERLVRVAWSLKKYEERMFATPSLGEVRAWSAESHSFEEMSPYWGSNPVLTGLGDATRITVMTVKSNLFSMLGVRPVLGRRFTADEDRQGGARAVVLSHRFWATRFGRDPRVLGRSLVLEGTPVEIVGVMPAGFGFPVLPAGFRSDGTDVWCSLSSSPEPFRPDGREAAEVVARLRHGLTIGQAKADLDIVEQRWSQSTGQQDDRVTVLTTLEDFAVGDVRPALLLALGAVALVLLIACANAANLLLARAESRRREMAIRSALGAGRLRILRQVLTESVLLALAGAAVGVLLATWGLPLLVSLAGKSLPRLQDVDINLGVLATTVAAALATGVLVGLVPAVKSLLASSSVALKEGGAGAGTADARVGGAFVIAQVALTLVLLIGAGLLGRSFKNLMTLKPGFEPAQVLVAQVDLPETRYGSSARKLAFVQAVIERTRALPGVTAVAISTGTPLAVGAIGSISIPGKPVQPEAPWASITAVTPEFFNTLGIPQHRGRPFAEGDGSGGHPIIVNEALVRTFFPDQPPLGQQVGFFSSRVGTIIGVVGDTRELSLAAEPPPVIYEPLAADAQGYLKVIVRTAGDPGTLAAPLRAALRALDPDLPINALQSMPEMMAESLATERFYAAVVAIFAALALLMAAAGVYALMGYTVVRRTRELGVRIALGAEARQVLAQVIGRGALLALIGIILGLGGALAATRVLKHVLFQIAPTDPSTFVGVSVVLTIVAVLASYLPARRATRVDPMIALRSE